MSIRLLSKKLVGQTIHGVRTRMGLSPADFAKSLGLADVAEVTRWERGTAQPDYGTLAKIAAMGVVDALVFQDAPAAGAQPQLTPGEATKLLDILGRMEGLMAEARTLVERATRRTAVELLESATAAPALDDGSARRGRSRTASAGRRAASSPSRGKTTTRARRADTSSSTSATAANGSASRSRSSTPRSRSTRAATPKTEPSAATA